MRQKAVKVKTKYQSSVDKRSEEKLSASDCQTKGWKLETKLGADDGVRSLLLVLSEADRLYYVGLHVGGRDGTGRNIVEYLMYLPYRPPRDHLGLPLSDFKNSPQEDENVMLWVATPSMCFTSNSTSNHPLSTA